MNLLDRLFSSGGCLICHSKESLSHGVCKRCEQAFGVINKKIDKNYPFIDKAYALMENRDFTREIISQMKFKERVYLAEIFAGFMADFILSDLWTYPIDRIAYIPMTLKKKRIRGFNQVEEMANILGQRTGLELGHMLKKTRHGKDQIGLSSTDRFTNVENSFEAIGIKTNERILLLDDIITTGATVMDASRALKEEGALSVYVLAITRTAYIDPHRR